MLARWMHDVSLRFGNPATERAYVESRTQQLITNLLRVLTLLLCLITYVIFIDIVPFPERYERGFELVIIRLGLQGLVFVISLLALVLVMTGGFRRCLNWVAREYVVLAFTVVVMVCTCFTNWYYLAKACGYDEPEDLQTDGVMPYGPLTDTGLVLLIDSMVTFTHIGMPIRWEVLLQLDVATILTFGAFAFGLGSPESENLLQTTVLLFSLVFGSAFGKRNMEKHERASFLVMLKEKSQRAELEFKLSQSIAEAESHAAEEESLHSDSTGGLFSKMRPQELHRVAELGAKEHWLLPDDALEIAPQQILGHGGFGIVAAGLLHGTPVAVKVPKRSAEDAPIRHFAMHANELRILRHLRNTHIVQFHGACIDLERGNLALVEELVEGPSLGGFLHGHGSGQGGDTPDDTDRHCLALGVCCGLRYLHAHDPRIVHGDLKPDNIRVELLNTKPLVKLIDFGLSQLIGGIPKRLGGSLRWMAPEVIVNQVQRELLVLPDPATDVFSFGRVLYFIAVGAAPLQDCEPLALLTAAKHGRPLPLQWPDDPPPFAAFCAPLAERCLTHDPEARPQIQRLHAEFLGFRPRGEGPQATSEVDPSSAEGPKAQPRSGHMPWHVGVQEVHTAFSPPRTAGL